jgi:quercetin dioxygenase-like cupin family protein
LRVLRSKKKWTAATFFGVAVIGTFAAVALASPGTGFVGQTPLVTAKFNNAVQLNHDRVKFQTKDPTDVRVQQFVIAPGGFSGWHHHPGIVIVSVASGAVTVTESDCSSKTYGPGLPNGAVFVEGADDPMQAANASASVGATVYATFVAPRADPPVFRIEDDPISCP